MDLVVCVKALNGIQWEVTHPTFNFQWPNVTYALSADIKTSHYQLYVSAVEALHTPLTHNP